MLKSRGYAALNSYTPLVPFQFERRTLRQNDIAIKILFSGVCHSDLHMVRNDWGVSTYPLVPGHEIVGKVIETGSSVKRHNVGDIVAIGCLVDSCMECDQCKNGDEQYCRNGATQTYGGYDRLSNELTQGGYSTNLVVREEFALSVPQNLDIKRVAPLLCAGVTTYKPLRLFNAGPGKRVGVIGLGGLGHMAVKLAAGMGAKVTAIGRNADKATSALKLGADSFLLSTDQVAMENSKNQFDLIIDTVPVNHDLNPYIGLLDIDGAMVMVGHIGEVDHISSAPLVFGRRILTGSNIAGLKMTQELLDFCGRKNILPECEIIMMDEINDAFDRLEKADVHYRFVIDMASL